jgi:hypothetical protein
MEIIFAAFYILQHLTGRLKTQLLLASLLTVSCVVLYVADTVMVSDVRLPTSNRNPAVQN